MYDEKTMNPPSFPAMVPARRLLQSHLGRLSLALVMVVVFSTNVRAAEAPEAAPQPPPARFTERNYLVEELGLAEELLRIEEARAEKGVGAPEKTLGARRSVLSLKRQLAAYDERSKRPTPEQEAERKRRAEEEQRQAEARKRAEEEEAARTRALKQELLPVLLDIAQKDADAQVRLAAVSSVGRLQLEASIAPLSRIAVKDPDNEVRHVALQNILSFRNATSTAVLLGLYDEFADANQKLALLAGLQESLAVTNEFGQTGITPGVPASAVPKLIQIARESAGRELRRVAVQRLAEVPGEQTSSELIALYDAGGDNEFRQLMVQHLSNRPDQTAARKLVAVAQTDPDPRTRQLAVDLMGRVPFGSNRSPSLQPAAMRMVQPRLPPAPPPAPR